MRAPDIPKGQEQIMSAHFALAQAVQAVSQSLHSLSSARCFVYAKPLLWPATSSWFVMLQAYKLKQGSRSSGSTCLPLAKQKMQHHFHFQRNLLYYFDRIPFCYVHNRARAVLRLLEIFTVMLIVYYSKIRRFTKNT